MKILQLRFKNLNSLAGEWSIDFNAPEYVSDGIFAISGPTGAGKTTILDAICLALYGRTPRLDSVSAGENEIMSRQTAECFAEVVFETREGRYKAHWSQIRARRKDIGALQQPKREISDAGTGKVLASQIRAAEDLVIETTGMDFGRFTQSMMLAQGGFATFLKAKGSDRAPILEQITGTEIYSRISRHVFARQKEEKTKLDQLMERNQDIVLLSPDEEAQLIADLEEKNNAKNIFSQKKEQLSMAINWLKTITQLRTDLEEIAREEIILTSDIEAFKPHEKILLNAKRAANLDGEYATLSALRNQQKTDLNLLAVLTGQMPGLADQLEATKRNFDAVAAKYADARKGYDALLELLKKVRAMDLEISQIVSGIRNDQENIAKRQDELTREKSKKEETEKTIHLLGNQKKTVEAYLSGRQADALLVTDLTGIQVKTSGLLITQQNIADSSMQLDGINRDIEAKKNELQTALTALESIIKQQQTDQTNSKIAEAELYSLLKGKTRQELLNQKDQLFLQIAELKKIAGFDAERAKLEDNKPCPLCGSKHHPYAEGNVPATTETEHEYAAIIGLLKQIEAADKRLTEACEKERKSTEQVNRLKGDNNIMLQQQAHMEEKLRSLTKDHEKHTSSYQKQHEELLKTLKGFGTEQVPGSPDGMRKLIGSLTARKEEWQKNEKLKSEIDNAIALKQAESKTSEESIIKVGANLKQDITLMDSLKMKLGEQKNRRIELFGKKVADDEENKSKELLKASETQQMQAQEVLRKSEQKYREAENRINDLHQNTGKRQTELDDMEKQFRVNITEHGFLKEEDYLACRLYAAEKEGLESRAKQLETMKVAIKTRKTEKEKSLATETQRNLTGEMQEDLSVQLSETSAKLVGLIEEAGALGERLKVNSERKATGAQLAQKIDSQKKEFERWDMLNDLIGMADGKKYRNFAQGLTFEIMISYANRQLAKLSDRYLLARDKNDPLELNVVDNYQAGEIRSTKNLSGGESFLVSLALALGLSRMASRKVNVDSLFLDEGFGTLDEETLETALGTLASLRQEGKLIGLISHVGALKERINARITVQPLREGRSTLSGPGVKNNASLNVKSELA